MLEEVEWLVPPGINRAVCEALVLSLGTSIHPEKKDTALARSCELKQETNPGSEKKVTVSGRRCA